MDELKTKLTAFYNKFNEDKRLETRHGQVEFLTSMKYIHEYLRPGDKIVDIGAGPGKYSLALKKEGYDVTAVELTRPNIGKLRSKDKELKIVEANAVDLYDPADRIRALKEAKRICKREIFVTYIMNEYAIIEYAFKDNNYLSVKDRIDEDFKIKDPDALFVHSRIEEIDELNKVCGLKLIRRFASDGPTDYMRSYINAMDDETFQAYLAFHQKTCERKELLGASSHIVDILIKED